MPQNIARLEVDELGPSPAPKDVAVGGLVDVASMMVLRILGFDVHQHFAGGRIALRCEVRAPRRSRVFPSRVVGFETAHPE